MKKKLVDIVRGLTLIYICSITFNVFTHGFQYLRGCHKQYVTSHKSSLVEYLEWRVYTTYHIEKLTSLDVLIPGEFYFSIKKINKIFEKHNLPHYYIPHKPDDAGIDEKTLV